MRDFSAKKVAEGRRTERASRPARREPDVVGLRPDILRWIAAFAGMNGEEDPRINPPEAV